MVFLDAGTDPKTFVQRRTITNVRHEIIVQSWRRATLNENIDDKVSGSEDEMADPVSSMLHFLGINRRKFMCSISLQTSRQSLGAFGSIRGNGRVVISGSSKRMPQDVLAVLKRIALEGETISAEADRFFRTLQRRGKYVLEAW